MHGHVIPIYLLIIAILVIQGKKRMFCEFDAVNM